MDDSASHSSSPDADPATPPVASGWAIPRLPLLIGVIGLGALVGTGTWVKRRADARVHAEAQGIQVEHGALKGELAEYRSRLENLRWTADRHRAFAQSASEPLKSWARERARRFDVLVERIDRGAEELRFRALSSEIESLCLKGEVDGARERLKRLPSLAFPSPTEFRRLHAELYTAPLAEFSRQNPDYYRAFFEHEPEAAKEDVVALRAELTAAGTEVITPRTLLGFELLGAVAPADDPVLADWATLSSAADFFEEPDAGTLQHWREAQKAVRAQDWQTAVNRMQAITRTTVRTRQPFRAAYGRAILRNTPDQTSEAYPLLQEAAQTGDRAARVWVSQEDYAKGRFGAALRWFEERVEDGEREGVAPLLAIYAMDRETVKRDAGRESGMLQKILLAPDAPPLASMLLARLHETGAAGAKSPEKAFACYASAAEKRFEPAWVEVARCYLNGTGTATDVAAAAQWACKAFASGEREQSVPMLIECMRRAPDEVAAGVQELFEHEQTAAPAGFNDTRVTEGGIPQLHATLARHFDQKGSFGLAARYYAKSGSRDVMVATRYAELTKANPCDTCQGDGKVQHSVPCATCSGKGMVFCSSCDGRGFSLAAGAPPCATCSGSGGVVQDGRAVACSTCSGTGKGKNSVTKKTCPQCVSGRVPCRVCTEGRITVKKECPACRGSGARALADM